LSKSKLGEIETKLPLSFESKSVLVTGSSSGIGRAIAEAFLAEGAEVAFNGRNADYLESVVAAQTIGHAIAVCGDVSKPDQSSILVEKVMAAFGKIDVLVCNVGSGRSVPPGSETHEEWLRVFELNLWSTTNMVEAAKDVLAKSRGVIVCISSICGQELVPGVPLTYSTAKAALNAYVCGIARPLGKVGVRINAVAPGNILFNGSVWQSKLNDDCAEVAQMLDRDVSLAKLGTPDDVANLALWLASSAASFCTGSIFVTDGGQVHN